METPSMVQIVGEVVYRSTSYADTLVAMHKPIREPSDEGCVFHHVQYLCESPSRKFVTFDFKNP